MNNVANPINCTQTMCTWLHKYYTKPKTRGSRSQSYSLINYDDFASNLFFLDCNDNIEKQFIFNR